MKIEKVGTTYRVVKDGIVITKASTKTGCQNVIDNFDTFTANANKDGYIDQMIDFIYDKCAEILFAMIDEFQYDDVVSADSMRTILAKKFPEVYKVEFKYTHAPYEVDRPARYKVHVATYGLFGTLTVTLHRPEEGEGDEFFATLEHTLRKYNFK